MGKRRIVEPTRFHFEKVTTESHATIVRAHDSWANVRALAYEHDRYMANMLRRVEGVDSPTLRAVKQNRVLIMSMIRLGKSVQRLQRRMERAAV